MIKKSFVFFLSAVFVFVWAVDDGSKCRSVEGSKSCGQCIKIDPSCAWCLDPRLNTSQRCDLKTAFTPETCAPHYVYSPITELKIAPQHNLPLGSKLADGVTTTQLEPQQVVIKMKPGDIIEVPFKYQHRIPVSGYEVLDFSIQTSEFRSLGLGIEFFIECNGTKLGGRVCPGVKVDQVINFYAKVTLNECKAGGDLAVSIGVYGYNTVSGLFITPICGCECEKLRNHERKSALCGHGGTSICGACLCEEGRGGNNCECPLAQFGASNADELEDRCRQEKDQPVCSGKGKCQCGTCQCNADFIRGKFCECDSTGCPLNVEGKLCSGQGECECGRCLCEEGFEGEDCSCTTDQKPCEENGVICSGNGVCKCGQCSCNQHFTGSICNIEQKTSEADADDLASSDVNENDGELLPPVEDTFDDHGNSTKESSARSINYCIDFLGVLSTIVVLIIGIFATRF